MLFKCTVGYLTRREVVSVNSKTCSVKYWPAGGTNAAEVPSLKSVFIFMSTKCACCAEGSQPLPVLGPVFLTLLNERHMMQENIRQLKCETCFLSKICCDTSGNKIRYIWWYVFNWGSIKSFLRRQFTSCRGGDPKVKDESWTSVWFNFCNVYVERKSGWVWGGGLGLSNPERTLCVCLEGSIHWETCWRRISSMTVMSALCLPNRSMNQHGGSKDPKTGSFPPFSETHSWRNCCSLHDNL